MDFDWARAIERNSEALNGIVAELFAMLGLAGEATVARIPQPLHRAVLRVLWPAESAVRRLIIIAARGLVVKLPAARPISRPMPAGANREGRSFLSLLPALRYAEKLRRAAPAPQKVQATIPHASISTRMIPCGRAPMADPVSPPDGLVRAERLMPEAPGPQAGARGSAAPGRRLARWRVSRRTCQVRSSSRRSGRVLHPATAGRRFTSR